jgi:hypothetical protein
MLIDKIRKQYVGDIPTSLLVSLISIQETLDSIFGYPKQQGNTFNRTTGDKDSLSVLSFVKDDPSEMVSQHVTSNSKTPVTALAKRRGNTFNHTTGGRDPLSVRTFPGDEASDMVVEPSHNPQYVTSDLKTPVTALAKRGGNTFNHTTGGTDPLSVRTFPGDEALDMVVEPSHNPQHVSSDLKNPVAPSGNDLLSVSDDDSSVLAKKWGQKPFNPYGRNLFALGDILVNTFKEDTIEEDSFLEYFDEESSFFPDIQSTVLTNENDASQFARKDARKFSPISDSAPKFLVKKNLNNTYSIHHAGSDLRARTFHVAATEQVNSPSKAVEFLFSTNKYLNKSLPTGSGGPLDLNDSLPSISDLTDGDPRRASRGASLIHQLKERAFAEQSQGL